MVEAKDGLARYFDLAALVAGRFTQALFSLALLKILTNKLPQDEVAHYYFIIATTTWFLLVLVNPVGMWAGRHALEWRDRFPWRPILWRHVFFYLAVTAFGVLIAVSVNSLFGLDRSLSAATLAFGVAGGIFFQSFYQQLLGLHNILGSRVLYSILIAVGQLLIFAAACGIFVVENKDVSHWFALVFAGNFFAGIMFVYFLSREFHVRAAVSVKTSDLLDRAQFMSFCLPIVGVTGAIWVQTQGYRMLVSSLGDLQLLAMMGVGLGLASNIGATLESLIQQYLIPDFYRSLHEPGSDSELVWRRMFMRVAIFLVVFCFGLFCYGHIVLRILTARSYVAGSRFIRWAAWIEFFRILANFVYLNAVGEKKILRAVPSFAIGAGVTLVCYAAAVFFRAHLEVLVLLGPLLGTFTNLMLQLRGMQRRTKWRPAVKPILAAALLAMPYASGFWISAEIPVGQLVAVVAGVGLYTLFALRMLIPVLKSV